MIDADDHFVQAVEREKAVRVAKGQSPELGPDVLRLLAISALNQIGEQFDERDDRDASKSSSRDGA